MLVLMLVLDVGDIGVDAGVVGVYVDAGVVGVDVDVGVRCWWHVLIEGEKQ